MERTHAVDGYPRYWPDAAGRVPAGARARPTPGSRERPRRPGRRPGGAAPGRGRTGPRARPGGDRAAVRPARRAGPAAGPPGRPRARGRAGAGADRDGAGARDRSPRRCSTCCRAPPVRRGSTSRRAGPGSGPTSLDLRGLGYGDVPPLQLWVYLVPRPRLTCPCTERRRIRTAQTRPDPRRSPRSAVRYGLTAFAWKVVLPNGTASGRVDDLARAQPAGRAAPARCPGWPGPCSAASRA